MNQELEQLIEKLEDLREAAKRAHLEDKAIAFDIAVNNAKAMIRSRPAENFGTVPEELQLILHELRRQVGRAESITEVNTLRDVMAMIQGRLAEINPRLAAEQRIQDMKHPTKIDLEDEVHRGPRKLVEVQTDGLGMRPSRIPRGIRHALRYVTFLVLTVALWKVTVDWLAGDAGTSVAGRITAAFFGLVALLLVSAYITEFNQKHD